MDEDYKEVEKDNGIEEAKWGEFDDLKNNSKFFSPKPETGYKLVFSSVRLVKKRFKNKGELRFTAICKIKTLDGQTSNQMFETCSTTILSELRSHVVDEEWKGEKITFFLKQKIEGNKTRYVFEDMTVSL